MHGTVYVVRLVCLIAAIFAVAAFAGCGGGGSSEGTPQLTSDQTSQDFSVNVWDDSFVDGGYADIEIRKVELEDGVYIELWAENARNLKALYFDVQFDPALYQLGSTYPGVLQDVGDEMLQLEFLDRPGSVHYGQIVAQYPEYDGFSGDGLLARVRFSPGHVGFDRLASVAPASDRCCAELAWNGTDNKLEWGYRNEGDYDQNSETNIADLTPLGKHFGKPGPFDPDSIEAVVDGDGNGEINISDITPIGLNYSAKVDSYNVYFSGDEADKPGTNTAESTLEPLETEKYDTAAGERGTGRLKFTCAVDLGALPQPLPETGYFWVRPSDGEKEGTPSTTAMVEGLNQPPEAALSATPLTGAAPLAVSFDASASSDPEASALEFSWDWDGPANGINWVESGPESSREHVYTESGAYTAMVRVMDDGGLGDSASIVITVTEGQNEDPVALLDATPLAGDAPLDVDFDASSSYDTDGSIVKYEFDLDGDGTFEQDNGANPATSTTYTEVGIVLAGVRVTDDQGATGTDTVSINVTDPASVGVFIRPDTKNYSWGDLPMRGDGSEEDPYIIGGAYAPAREYGFIANTKADFTGQEIALGDLTWVSDPPELVEWISPGVLTKAVAEGTGFIYAKDASLKESNRIYATVTFNYPPEAILVSDVWIGTEPLEVQFDATRSFDWDGSIVQYEFDLDGDGVFELDNGPDPFTTNMYPKGNYNVEVRVTDDLGATKTGGALIISEEFPVLLGPDMIYALPSTTVAHDGDVVTITVYTNQAANPFHFMNGARLVLPQGNFYHRYSFNPGERGGSSADADGVWADVAPINFLLPPDNLFGETDLGGGLIAIDFNVTPLGGVDIDLATGAMFNFGLVVHTNVDITFQRVSGVSRTYYSSMIGGDYFWADDDNSGMPGITLVP